MQGNKYGIGIKPDELMKAVGRVTPQVTEGSAVSYHACHAFTPLHQRAIGKPRKAKHTAPTARTTLVIRKFLL